MVVVKPPETRPWDAAAAGMLCDQLAGMLCDQQNRVRNTQFSKNPRERPRVDHGPSFLAWPLDLGPPNSSSSILALPLQRLGRRWPRALRLCLLPAALLAVAAHATADATVYHQNLLLQFSHKLSWLGSCLAPPRRGLRPTPALCAPSRGCDEPVARHCLPRSADEVRAVRRG